MKIVEDPKILSAFQEKEEVDLKPGKLVEDENIISQFNKLETEEGIENTVKKSLGAVKEFFTGTKRTEYPEIPEIGSYKGTGAAKIAAGLLINPNQKAQAEIIQAQVPGSKILKDNFDNIIVAMPDGKSFYLNKPGASEQDILQTTGQILQYIPGYSTAIKAAGKSLLKRTLYSGVAGGATSVAQDIATKPLGAKDIDTTRAVISTAIPIVFEGAINPIAAKTWKSLVGNPKFSTKIDGKLVLNAKGKKAAKAAGIDVDNMMKNLYKVLVMNYQKV